MSATPSVSVLVPTWKRPDSLERCLLALDGQTRRPAQVVVTVRSDDDATWALADRLPARLSITATFLSVPAGPLTAAMNAGLARTTGDLVALTDDDAEPWPDWLERCQAVMVADPAVAGVGGRDWQPHDQREVRQVGVVSWYGRVIGNHHLGIGPARDVDILKGVNACFRGDLLRRIGFDRRLRGQGNVSHWEVSLCLSMRRQGWRLVYDPAIAVDHRPAIRHDGDVNTRGGFESLSHQDATYNETLAVMDHLSPYGRVAGLVWATAIGTMASPGPIQALRRWVQLRERPGLIAARVRASWSGRFAATFAWTQGHRQAAS